MDTKKLPAIVDGAVVALYYTLKDDQGGVIDTNRKGGEPLVYMHGKGQIVKGLEKELEGKAKDDYVEVSVSPAEGYGDHDPEAVGEVPVSAFPEPAKLEVGMVVTGRDGQGNVMQARVLAVGEETVRLDQNHPLAGQTLNFEVTVAGIREASREELEHGHPHGPGGHAH